MKKFFALSLLSLSILTYSWAQEAKKPRPNLPGHLLLDYGFNQMLNAPLNGDLKFVGSRSINIAYLYELPLGNSPFTFNPGLGVSNERFSFSKRVSLATNPDSTSIATIEDIFTGRTVSPEKSFFANTYLDMPLEFRFYSNKNDTKRSLMVALGGKLGYRVDTMTKIKFTEDGETKKVKYKEDFHMSDLRYGAYLRVGIGGFNAWYYHSFNTLFDSGKGPGQVDTTPISFGISLEVF